MEVKPGYKQTEVGVIPEEWEVEPLGDFVRITSGESPSLFHFTNSGLPYFKVEQLSNSEKYLHASSTPYYFESGKTVPRGSVVFAKRGAAIALNKVRILAHESFMDTNLMALTPAQELDGEFLFYALGYIGLWRFADTTSVPQINNKHVKPLPFPFPKPPEQRAIATALSDVDGLLGGLDRLIAKKRDLKQATMQQLLAGQTRLPGFHGDWEVKRLKQVAEISTGINKPLSEMGSGALYVTVQDLYDKTSIRTEKLSRIKVSPSEIEARGLMVGDIVFGKSSVKRDGIGYPSQFLGCDEPVVFSGFTYRARARQGITDATFLFYALREEKTRRWLIDNSQASALTNINQTIADAIPILVPPSVPEQTAIAEVLTEMDEELAVLEQRREKTRALKQAMMQELLTGRTRLV